MIDGHNFDDLIAAVLEESNKSIGYLDGLQSIGRLPGINKSGKASPGVRKTAEHGFKIIKGNYRWELTSNTLGYVTKKHTYKVALDNARGIIRSYFAKSFMYGMRAQAGSKALSNNFDLSQQHYEWIARAAEEELSYYKNLLTDIRYKRTTKPGRMDWSDRIQLFIKTLDSVFDAGRVAATPENILLIWVVDIEAEHCKGCILLEENSPYTKDSLPCTPRDGSTECLSNCKCKIVMKKVTPQEYRMATIGKLSKSALLLQLRLLKDRRGMVHIRNRRK